MDAPITRPCPTCRKAAAHPKENRWFPFCTERCKAVDLGKWLSGEYRVPGDDADDGERGSGTGEGATSPTIH